VQNADLDSTRLRGATGVAPFAVRRRDLRRSDEEDTRAGEGLIQVTVHSSGDGTRLSERERWQRAQSQCGNCGP
jgi:hypothetical protein